MAPISLIPPLTKTPTSLGGYSSTISGRMVLITLLPGNLNDPQNLAQLGANCFCEPTGWHRGWAINTLMDRNAITYHLVSGEGQEISKYSQKTDITKSSSRIQNGM